MLREQNGMRQSPSQILFTESRIPQQLPKGAAFQVSISVNRHGQDRRVTWPIVDVVGA